MGNFAADIALAIKAEELHGEFMNPGDNWVFANFNAARPGTTAGGDKVEDGCSKNCQQHPGR